MHFGQIEAPSDPPWSQESDIFALRQIFMYSFYPIGKKVGISGIII
jgi:hypothetical protein